MGEGENIGVVIENIKGKSIKGENIKGKSVLIGGCGWVIYFFITTYDKIVIVNESVK